MSTTIESLNLQIRSNSKTATKGIDALTQSLTSLKQATKGGLGLSAVVSGLGKLSSSANQASTSATKATASFTDFYHKLKTGAQVIKRISSAIYSAIEKSNDYIENVNLFTVSMGEYAGEAMTYAETISDAMGIDTSEWIRSQGIFMTLATGFGVASDRANTMSKNLTQLGYDLSSFFNIDIEDAMQKLQSGLSGELEPLRRLGYDLSQAKLEATALELGIDKSVSAMTQAEKAQLRYYAIMTQVTTAQGDMARTLDDPANQLRVLKAQVSMAAREIGNAFIPALNAILPYAIAITKVIRGLANTIASLFGYEMPEVENATSGVVENTDAVSENLQDAQKEAKKLKSYMLGFDELNIINSNEGASSEDTSGMFDFELPEYDFLEGLMESKVAIIVEEMKEWLGITEDIDSWAELLDTRLGNILKTVGLIGAGFAAWKIGTFVAGLVSSFSHLTGISTALSAIETVIAGLSAPVLAIVAAVLAVVAGLTAVYLTNEEVRTTIKGLVRDIGKAFVPLLTLITDTIIPDLKSAWKGLLKTVRPLGEWLSTVFTSIWMDMIAPALSFIAETVIPTLISTLENLWNGVLVPLGEFMSSVLTPIIEKVAEVLTWLWKYVILPLSDFVGGVAATAWVNIAKIYNETVIPIVQGVIKVFQFLWDNVLSPIVEFLWAIFSPAIKTVFEGVGNYIGSLKTTLQGLMNFITGVFTLDWEQAWNGICQFFTGLWDSAVTTVTTIFTGGLEVLKGIWSPIASWFDENVIKPIANFFRGLWESVSSFFVNLWNDIVSVWNLVATWFDENVIQPVASFFEGLVLRIGQFFEGCWIIVQAVWLVASTWFDENVIQPIANFFKGLWESVAGFFKELWSGIKKIWQTVASWFNNNVVTPTIEWFRSVWYSVSSFFSNLWSDIKAVWNIASTWFNDTIIDPVKRAFRTACDAIEGYFYSLWLSIRQGVAGAMNGVIGGIESAINWVVRGINGLLSGFNEVVEWAADLIGADWDGVTLVGTVSLGRISIPTYAEGGFPEQGQMFIAREAGAEMVGNIGRRTAVANNDQIVSGIAGGVAEANEEQNILLREQNSLLRSILEKDSGVYLDGKNLTNSVEKHQRERGRVLITGGVI